eukprot:5357303-Amphidinium_carterae.1
MLLGACKDVLTVLVGIVALARSCGDCDYRHKSGITIGKHGLEDPRWNSLNGLNAEDIDVDTTQLLGRGAGGVVTRAKHRPTGIDLAVKVLCSGDTTRRMIQVKSQKKNLQMVPFSVHQVTCKWQHVCTCIVFLELRSVHAHTAQAPMRDIFALPSAMPAKEHQKLAGIDLLPQGLHLA